MTDTTVYICDKCGETPNPCNCAKQKEYDRINKLVSFWTAEYILQIVETNRDDLYKVLQERYTRMKHGD